MNDLDLLVARLQQENGRPVAFLVGAPLSVTWGPPRRGVPDVSGMIDRIAFHMTKEGREAEFRLSQRNIQAEDRYQSAFSFVQKICGPLKVDQIVREAVLEAYTGSAQLHDDDGSPEDWHLPTGTAALGRILASGHPRFRGPVLTTNFDPLISHAVSLAGATPSRRVYTTDGPLPLGIESGDSIPIIHLHGYWRGSTTYHISRNLRARRNVLTESIRELLRGHLLLVSAYGGWEDVFMAALDNALSAPNADIDVLWSFFSDNDKTTPEHIQKLLEKSNRITPYYGIDTHELFARLADVLSGAPPPPTLTTLTNPTLDGSPPTIPPPPHSPSPEAKVENIVRSSRALRLTAGVDIPIAVATSYARCEHANTISLVDQQLALEDRRWTRSALLATKAETLIALGKYQEANSLFNDAAALHSRDSPHHWAYKIRASVAVRWFQEAQRLVTEAMDRFPSNEDIWLLHAHAHVPTAGIYNYINDLPEEVVTDDLVNTAILIAGAACQWSQLQRVQNEIANSVTLSLEAKLSFTRALLELIPAPRNQPPPPSLYPQYRSALAQFTLIAEEAKVRQDNYDAQDVRLEALLYAADCYRVLQEHDRADSIIDVIASSFAGHLASIRAQYLELANEGRVDRARHRARAVLASAPPSGVNHALVLRDYMALSVIVYQNDQTEENKQELLDCRQHVRSFRSRHEQGDELASRIGWEDILQLEVILLRDLEEYDEALLRIREDRTSDPLFRLAIEVRLLDDLGKRSDVRSLCASGGVKRLVSSAKATSKEVFIREAAKELSRVDEHEQAIMLFDLTRIEHLGREEVYAFAYSLYCIRAYHKMCAVVIEWQRLNGYDPGLAQNLLATAAYADPVRILEFFGGVEQTNYSGDSAICRALNRIALMFGDAFRLSKDTLRQLSATASPAHISSLVLSFAELGDMASAYELATEHAIAHFRNRVAQISFLMNIRLLRLWWHNESRACCPSFPTVYSMDNQHYLLDGADKYRLAGLQYADPDSFAHHRIFGDPSSVVTRSLPEFLEHQAEAILSSLEDSKDVGGNDESDPSIKLMWQAEVEHEIASYIRKKATDVRCVNAAASAQPDIYIAARHATIDVSSQGVNLSDATLAIYAQGRHPYYAHHSPPCRELEIPDDANIVLDITAILNIALFVSRFDFLGDTPWTYLTPPQAFMELGRLRDLITGRSGPLAIPISGFAGSARHYHSEAREVANGIAAENLRRHVKIVAVYPENIREEHLVNLSSGASSLAILEGRMTPQTWIVTDSTYQHETIGNLGFNHMCTRGFIDACVRAGALNRDLSSKILIEMFGSGYSHCSSIHSYTDRIVGLLAQPATRTSTVGLLMAGLRRSDISVDLQARLFADLLIKLWRRLGANESTSEIADAIRVHSLRWSELDFRVEVYHQLVARTGTTGVARNYAEIVSL